MEKYLTWGLEKEIDEMSESLSAKMEGSAQKRKKTTLMRLCQQEPTGGVTNGSSGIIIEKIK